MKDVNVHLIDLLEEGRYSKVKRILQGGQKMTVKVIDLNTGKESSKVVDVVYDVNEKDHYNRTVLMWALVNKQSDIAIELIRQGADIDVRDDFGFTFVALCAESGCYKVLKYALSQHDKAFNKELVNRKFGAYVSTPLHRAVKFGFYRVAELLLKNGVDPNVYDYNYLPPIAYPVISCDVKMVRLLLKYGARADLTNANGVDMLQFALGNNVPEGHVIARMLILDVLKRDGYKEFLKKDYDTAVHYGNSVIAEEILTILMDFPKPPDIK